MGINMDSPRLARRLSAVAGGLAIVGMVSFTASCAKEEEKAPETSTTTTTTTTATTTSPAAPPSPTEKSINPTGPNAFTPTHVEPAAPPTGRHGERPADAP
ncbi:type IV secretory pathway VirB10-like protein [Mycobacterium sp. URHB0021]